MLYIQKMSNGKEKVINLVDFKPLLINKNRLMCLDLGKKRIGISISTSNFYEALPLRTVAGDRFSDLLDTLNQLIKEYNIIGIIFGMPFNMDGTEGKSAQSVKDKASKIGEELNLNYAFWDERLSTVAIERLYKKPEKSRSKKKSDKKDIDNLASAFILEGALNYIMRH